MTTAEQKTTTYRKRLAQTLRYLRATLKPGDSVNFDDLPKKWASRAYCVAKYRGRQFGVSETPDLDTVLIIRHR